MVKVTIEKLVYGGEGLAHRDGRTVFVPYVLPEEVVAVDPVEQKKKFVRGRLLEIVTASPARVAAPCAHFTECGGCHYQHISYEDQLRYKCDILRETLRRIGRIEWTGPITSHASPPLGYRNRAQWKVRPLDDAPRMGYFRSGSTALCAVSGCPILAPRVAEAFEHLRRLVQTGSLPSTLREVEAFTDAEGQSVLLNVSLTELLDSPERIAAQLREGVPGTTTILLHESSRDRYHLHGPGFVHYNAGGRAYRVGHLSFFQVNRFLIEEMLQAVKAGARGKLALDLYSGVGLFSLALAATFDRVIAVESNPAAARDLSANVEGTAAQAVNRDVGEFLRDTQQSPDLVVLDPPRAGVEAETLKRLAALAPACMTYVSCDPATLARDLGALVAGGYALVEMHLFDVFPQTYHIETLARLERRE